MVIRIRQCNVIFELAQQLYCWNSFVFLCAMGEFGGFVGTHGGGFGCMLC